MINIFKLNLFQQIFLCKVKRTEKVTFKVNRLFIVGIGVIIGDWKIAMYLETKDYNDIQ